MPIPYDSFHLTTNDSVISDLFSLLHDNSSKNDWLSEGHSILYLIVVNVVDVGE